MWTYKKKYKNTVETNRPKRKQQQQQKIRKRFLTVAYVDRDLICILKIYLDCLFIDDHDV